MRERMRSLSCQRRYASAAARRLYAGVKETKEGLDIKMHDPLAASQMVAKHLGMFVERVGGPDGGAIPVAVTVTRRLIRPGKAA